MDTETAFHFSPRPNRAHEIGWRPWGPDAFAEAEAAQKPILLSLSAVWCHWCHVMDETTYSDPVVQSLIRDHFIPVRVDNDQRPDINLRYNMGGWPTTAFLTPWGDVITGATYVPPDAMRNLLQQVLQYWQANREQLPRHVAPAERLDPTPGPAAPDPAGVNDVMQAIAAQFDRAYGGLGVAPKFPQVDVWELCLSRWLLAGDGASAGMAVRTLDAMAGSALFDPVAGGFFRYSTTREWTVPHFEKLLDDNARLLRLYLHALQITGDPFYANVARQIVGWMRQALLQPDGLFGGSQDADEAYYRLGPEERAQRPAPYVDPTAFAGPNAAAVSGLLLAAGLLDADLKPLALTCLEALFIQLWDDDRGLAHANRGEPLRNWLGDLAPLGTACLDAYELTGDTEHLRRAEAIAAVMDRELRDGQPGFLDRPPDPKALGRLAVTQKPLAENAEALAFLHRLGRLTRDPARQERALGELGAFLPVARRLGIFGAGWALAVTVTGAPPIDAHLVYDTPEQTLAFRQALFALYLPNRAVHAYDVDSPEREAAGYPDEPLPALYLCRGTVCAPPVTTPEGVPAALQTLFAPPSGAGTA
jgi:uncharacterized protein YyaL (SSP411 family)